MNFYTFLNFTDLKEREGLKLCIKDPRGIRMLAMWPLAGVRAGNTALTVDSGEVCRRRRGKRRGEARGSRGRPSGSCGWGRRSPCRPAHGEAEAAAEKKRRGGAPVAKRGRRLAGQLREDAAELKARLVQAE
jgi:hypothetical protein